jgi:hypothetical protein
MAKQPDVNNSKSSKPAKGMKNEDGREGGSKYNGQNKAAFSPKDCGVEPNNDSKPLDGKRKGLETGAY